MATAWMVAWTSRMASTNKASLQTLLYLSRYSQYGSVDFATLLKSMEDEISRVCRLLSAIRVKLSLMIVIDGNESVENWAEPRLKDAE
jgi:hypothetical protein